MGCAQRDTRTHSYMGEHWCRGGGRGGGEGEGEGEGDVVYRENGLDSVCWLTRRYGL